MNIQTIIANAIKPPNIGNAKHIANVNKTSNIKKPVEIIQAAKQITSINTDSPIKNDINPPIMFAVYEFCICSNIITALYISKLSSVVSAGSNVIVLSGTSFGSIFVALQ